MSETQFRDVQFQDNSSTIREYVDFAMNWILGVAKAGVSALGTLGEKGWNALSSAVSPVGNLLGFSSDKSPPDTAVSKQPTDNERNRERAIHKESPHGQGVGISHDMARSISTFQQERPGANNLITFNDSSRYSAQSIGYGDMGYLSSPSTPMNKLGGQSLAIA